MTRGILLGALLLFCQLTAYLPAQEAKTEIAQLTFAPNVPPPIIRKEPAVIKAYLNAANVTAGIAPRLRYVFWTFNGHTPAPFIRTRQGDTLQMEFSSTDDRGMSHNVDFHARARTGGNRRRHTSSG